jgi:hypothetical protein
MKRPKRPRDPAQLANQIVDIATGEVEEPKPSAKEIRAHKGGWAPPYSWEHDNAFAP